MLCRVCGYSQYTELGALVQVGDLLQLVGLHGAATQKGPVRRGGGAPAATANYKLIPFARSPPILCKSSRVDKETTN